jgi:atypical dual specificity phosphatase
VGYVEPEPVARRIDDLPVYVGNERAARAATATDPDAPADLPAFANVLSLSRSAVPATTHHRPLVDGPAAEWTSFERAVDTACDLLGRDGDALIHCTAGVSRSCVVTATALAATDRADSLTGALAAVRRARPVATPHPRLVELAVVYLASEAPGRL